MITSKLKIRLDLDTQIIQLESNTEALMTIEVEEDFQAEPLWLL